MNVYIGARFSMAPEANALAAELKDAKYDIASSWHTDDSEPAWDNPVIQAQRAMRDYTELMGADAFVQLTGNPREDTRGGQHVELGMAIAWNKVIIVVGQRGHVFHYLETIGHVDHASQVVEGLEEWLILEEDSVEELYGLHPWEGPNAT